MLICKFYVLFCLSLIHQFTIPILIYLFYFPFARIMFHLLLCYICKCLIGLPLIHQFDTYMLNYFFFTFQFHHLYFILHLLLIYNFYVRSLSSYLFTNNTSIYHYYIDLLILPSIYMS